MQTEPRIRPGNAGKEADAVEVPSVRGVLDSAQSRMDLVAHKADLILAAIRPRTPQACVDEKTGDPDQPLSLRAQKLYESSEAVLDKLCEIIEALG